VKEKLDLTWKSSAAVTGNFVWNFCWLTHAFYDLVVYVAVYA